jgi:hypothetical protein
MESTKEDIKVKAQNGRCLPEKLKWTFRVRLGV